MRPGLVLSDEQCSERFGPRKGEEEDRGSREAEHNIVEQRSLQDKLEASHNGIIELECEAAIKNEFAVLMVDEKSYAEQNKIRRTMFLSIFSTGSVNAQKISDDEVEKLDRLNDSLTIMLSFQIHVKNTSNCEEKS